MFTHGGTMLGECGHGGLEQAHKIVGNLALALASVLCARYAFEGSVHKMEGHFHASNGGKQARLFHILALGMSRSINRFFLSLDSTQQFPFGRFA
jgi:hypothetical protein